MRPVILPKKSMSGLKKKNTAQNREQFPSPLMHEGVDI